MSMHPTSRVRAMAIRGDADWSPRYGTNRFGANQRSSCNPAALCATRGLPLRAGQSWVIFIMRSPQMVCWRRPARAPAAAVETGERVRHRGRCAATRIGDSNTHPPVIDSAETDRPSRGFQALRRRLFECVMCYSSSGFGVELAHDTVRPCSRGGRQILPHFGEATTSVTAADTRRTSG